MNKKLKIMHNDNHFNNILIKTALPETESKYEINKIEYTKTKNFRLCFYDFDRAFLFDEPNPFLHHDSLIQNKQSAKDIWTLLNSLVRYIYYSAVIPDRNREFFLNTIFDNSFFDKIFWEQQQDLTNYKHLDYIGTIVALILNYSRFHLERFEEGFSQHINSKRFWNAYCIDNVQKPCVIPDEPFLYPENVLFRLIEDDYINKILGFTSVDSFYKKYLKYKSKYLKLKNKK